MSRLRIIVFMLALLLTVATVEAQFRASSPSENPLNCGAPAPHSSLPRGEPAPRTAHALHLRNRRPSTTEIIYEAGVTIASIRFRRHDVDGYLSEIRRCVGLTPYFSIPSSARMNTQESASSSSTLARGLPAPWPAFDSKRSRIGRSDDVAACNRAAILRA